MGETLSAQTGISPPKSSELQSEIQPQHNKINFKYFKDSSTGRVLPNFCFSCVVPFVKAVTPSSLLPSAEIACPANYNKKIYQVSLHTTAFICSELMSNLFSKTRTLVLEDLIAQKRVSPIVSPLKRPVGMYNAGITATKKSTIRDELAKSAHRPKFPV